MRTYTLELTGADILALRGLAWRKDSRPSNALTAYIHSNRGQMASDGPNDVTSYAEFLDRVWFATNSAVSILNGREK